MTKHEATLIYRRMLRCIEKKRFCVQFKTDPTMYGKMDWGTPDKMIINPRVSTPIARTVLHECLHLLNDEMPECEVIVKEKKLFEAMSDRQLEGLLKKVFAYDLDMTT